MAWMLACDIGTTTLKLGAIAPDGRVLGLVRHEYDLDTPAPDIVELGADVYWTFYKQGVRELLAGADVDPAELKGLSFSSQATTFLFRDKQGDPLGPFIVWLDTRADAEAAEIHARFDASDIYRRTAPFGSGIKSGKENLRFFTYVIIRFEHLSLECTLHGNQHRHMMYKKIVLPVFEHRQP